MSSVAVVVVGSSFVSNKVFESNDFTFEFRMFCVDTSIKNSNYNSISIDVSKF
ncbi:hypothetical protein D3C83_238580 [compost metagenome]